MSDRSQTATPSIDAHGLDVTYSNYFRTSAGEGEVLLDFGLHAFHHEANGRPEPIRLTNRLVLSWPTARMLSRALLTLLQQHDRPPDNATRSSNPPAPTPT